MSWTAERMESVVRALADQAAYSSPSCDFCRESMHESCTSLALDAGGDHVVCRCFLSFTHDRPENAAEDEEAEDACTCAGCGVHNPEGHAYVIVGGDAKDILGITEVGRLPLCQGCDCRISSGFSDPRRALMDAFDLVQDLQNLSRSTSSMTMEEITTLDARVEEMRRRVEHITGEQR